MSIPHAHRIALTALASCGLLACSGSDGTIDTGSFGGNTGTSGSVGGQTGTGGSTGLGGSSSNLGGASSQVGGSNNGGSSTTTTTGGPTNQGGTTTGGATASGGRGGENSGGTNPSVGGAIAGRGGAGGSNAMGGAKATGGTKASGGTNSGGNASTGGTGKGGTTTGGTSTGGVATGGVATGGVATGGATTGGASMGGTTGSCTPSFADPPADVAAWVNESWNSQLGSNVRSRQAWLLDSVMKGKGQINLCVRWGATTAPSAAVKTGMAAAVQKWFNDWFSQLKDYGCFPYPTVTTKVTGWAVRPGNTSWVSDLGSDVRVYTETDGEGEPKCSDSCSFFTNWSHSFPNCAGGEAFHHDYWLWLDDSISGGAAAVGGDWGLRMPVNNFISAMNKSNLVIEHEIGHGFGFQDYYTWTGARPTGGSLMIVGSTSSQSPTTADTWLLRRTWKEMKALRGW